jgi:hypothetical protein
MKNVKSIKEATEMVHMDRELALHYMATMRDFHYAALPANGPDRGLQGRPKGDRSSTLYCGVCKELSRPLAAVSPKNHASGPACPDLAVRLAGRLQRRYVPRGACLVCAAWENDDGAGRRGRDNGGVRSRASP